MSKPGDPPFGEGTPSAPLPAQTLDDVAAAGESSSSSSSSVGAGAAAAPVSISDPHVGAIFGKYRLLRLLGRGGMGSVYEGEDTVLKRSVAIKLLPRALHGKPVVFGRFMREAQVAGRFSHPNIITVYDVIKDDRGCCIVMELLHAGSVGARLKRGPYHYLVATRIAADCCLALKTAHRAGIIHRDVKPDNILFSDAGVVKLIDFGLVKLIEDDMKLTKSGAVCGTPAYMSPEQARRQKVDFRSDLYSLGATYYSMLTGWPPFWGTSVVQILLNNVQKPTPDPRELIPEIPEACVRVLMRAMNKKPEARYQSAEEMSADLEAILRGTSQRLDSIFDIDKDAPPPLKRPTVVTASSHSVEIPAPENPLHARPKTLHASVLEVPPSLLEPESESSRRRFLLWSGLSALGLAASAWSFVRLHRKKPENGSPSGPLLSPLKIGLIHSLSGSLAVAEHPLADAELLAIEELNQEGGVLGRPLLPVLMDGKSELASDSAFAHAAEYLLAKEKVAVVFGGYGSAGRKAMRPYFEKYKQLLFYPAQYEGLEASPNIVYTGATPNQFAMPAIRYCLEKLRVRRFYLVGTDGLRAHAINAVVEDLLKELGGAVVGAHYDLFGEYQFGSILKKIEHVKPEIIINVLVGDSAVAFFRELLSAGITAAALPVLSFTFGENELGMLSSLDLAGHYVARTRFAALAVDKSVGFSQKFKTRYGEHRPVSEDMEVAYLSVHLWAAAVKRAGTEDVDRVRAALTAAEFDLAGARLRIDAANQHAWKVFALGRIGAGNHVEIVRTDDTPIPPLPFPSSRTPMEWQQFIDALYRSWGENWANLQKPSSNLRKKK